MKDLGNALGLYVHWPYCARICPYCDFNVYRPKGEEDLLFGSILANLEQWREMTGPSALASIHFGGGTPSLMTARQIGAFLERAEALWGFETGIEIGLEANPNDAAAFPDLAAAGIERVSLGVQSFDNSALKQLGRDHDAEMARASISAAQHAFSRLSIDMIYARAGQGLDDWRAELGAALELGLDHISPYQLTIEAGTAFGKRAERGETLAAPPDFAADLFELTQDMCADAGLPAYEISNHARSVAHQSRHNRIYWEGGDWIGAGPGAHGRIGRASTGGRVATSTLRRPREYAKAVSDGTGRAIELERLDASQEAVERILMGMRLTDGLDLAHLNACTGQSVDPDGLARMTAEGFVEQSGTRVRLTPQGRLLADGVSARLVP
ncbi:radical SAM family heme chaperone HemW [Maricaulis sp. CAU 1757]